MVVQDRVPLRAAARSAAPTNALLWQGETLEVRGERLDYLQVYDYRRERGGFVRAAEVQRISLKPGDAAGLLAVVRFLRGVPGAEALGIGYAAAYIEAAPAEVLNSEVGVEALDAIGGFAERLANRASSAARQDKPAQAALAAHLDVAARHGVNFTSIEREGRAQICYDGQAFRRVLAMRSSSEQRGRAALALTRADCMPGELRAAERRALDEWRADVLDRVEPTGLPAYLRNRVLLRRAGVWAGLAYQRARKGEDATSSAARALAELAGIEKATLAEEDARAYNDAAMQVSASRWAAFPLLTKGSIAGNLQVTTVDGEPGETCVLLVDGKRKQLARRCTYALVWTASATVNREANAVALAVQPTEGWRELWIFRKSAKGWSVRVLPPAPSAPQLGYAEFAGWVPGGHRILVAREARGEGKYRKSFELVRLDTLASVGQAPEPEGVHAFKRWQDASWKQNTVSVR